MFTVYLFKAMHFVYHGRKFNTVELLKSAIITKWQKLSQRFIDIIASVSGVVVLNVLWRIAVDITAISLE